MKFRPLHDRVLIKVLDSEEKTKGGIILSDNTSDVYESNLMRRICGLLYLPDKLSGEIKLNIIKEVSKSKISLKNQQKIKFL